MAKSAIAKGVSKGMAMTFRTFMDVALTEARAAATRGEVPVGAVIVNADGVILAQAGNRTRELNDPSAHAEMLVIREACAKLGVERLENADLYVTLEPCAMCAAVISAARVRRLYYAASDPKSGGVSRARAYSRTPKPITNPRFTMASARQRQKPC